MSDFLFSNDLAFGYPAERIEAALRSADVTTIQSFRTERTAMTVARPGDAGRWGPIHDVARGIVFAVLGHPVFDDPRALDAKPADTSLATLLYQDYLRSDLAAFRRVHGSFAIVIHLVDTAELIIRTDPLGTLPVYRLTGAANRIVLSSHPDLLAAVTRASELDLVSLAEQLRCGRGVHPYTHYRAIRELDYASEYQINLANGELKTKAYWRPRFEPDHRRKRVTEQLADALVKAVRRRTDQGSAPIGVFLSGGADSRNLLFAAARRDRLKAFTLCDTENREVRYARALAQRAGVAHQVLTRDPDYYPRHAPRTLRLAGGHWNFEDSHFVGIEPQLREAGIESVLTGCFADYLLKGLTLNRQPIRLGGIKLPMDRAAPFNLVHGYLWQLPLAPQWLTPVRERLEEELGDHDPTRRDAVTVLEREAKRTFPLSRTCAFASRSSLWRLLPWASIFTDLDIIDVYQHLAPAAKLNGTVFRRAVALICAEAADIGNANDGLRLDASGLSRLCHGLFTERGHTPEPLAGVATDGSWPNWAKVMDSSQVMRQQWEGFGTESKALAIELLGFDPWHKPLSCAHASDVELFCRLYSLLIWFEHRVAF